MGSGGCRYGSPVNQLSWLIIPIFLSFFMASFCAGFYINRLPLTACIPGLTSDDECPLDKACVNRQCINPCESQNNCAPNTDCFVTNHRPQCRCRPGYIGNPREHCRRPELRAQPECRTDSDCPRSLACIDEVCRDPCTVRHPCHPSAQCRVIDSSPVKTMTCSCPPGTIGDGYTECAEP